MPERFARNTRVEEAPMKDETVLFNPGNNRFCVLNSTAAFIWQSLSVDQPLTVREIAGSLVERFENVGIEQAESDVRRTLSELHQIECLVPVPE